MSLERIKRAMKYCGPVRKSGPPSPRVLTSTDSAMPGPSRPKMAARLKQALGLNAAPAGPAAGGASGQGLGLPQPKPNLGGPAAGGLGGSPGSSLGQPPVPPGGNPKPPANPMAGPGMKPPGPHVPAAAPGLPKPPQMQPPTDPAAFAKMLGEQGPPPKPPEITLDEALHPPAEGQGPQDPLAGMPGMNDLMGSSQPAPPPQLPPNRNSMMPDAQHRQLWMQNLENDPNAMGRLRKAMGAAPPGKTEMLAKQGGARINPGPVPQIKQPMPNTRTRERFKRMLKLPLPNEPEKFAAALSS